MQKHISDNKKHICVYLYVPNKMTPSSTKKLPGKMIAFHRTENIPCETEKVFAQNGKI